MSKFGFPNIFIELSEVIVLTPIKFNIFDPHFNRGLSFLLSSDKSLKCDIPFAFAAIKKIIKNSSIALLLSLEGQFIALKDYVLSTYISAIFSPL